MALIAAVAPRRRGKLPIVFILVAIEAGCELDFVAGRLAGRSMTVGALDLGVRRDQRKLGFGVISHRVGGRNPSFNGVAAFAASFVSPRKELAAMWVGLVAVRALDMGNLRLEVGALVAGEAGNLKVLAQQRVVGLGVIEGGREGGFLPCKGGVAALAALLELALVRISMAGRTGGKLKAGIFGQAIIAGPMAFLAGYLFVGAGERVAGG